jgi:hypothetical protein
MHMQTWGTGNGWRLVTRAVYRARLAILSIAGVNALGVLIGALMVHSGNEFALSYGDKLVARAQKKDAAAISYRQGHRFQAAVRDFTMNLVVGAVPQTMTGLTVVSPYGFGAYRGWVGGIVSVDRNHQSRLRDWRKGAYYVITLILQLIPYSLAGGIGVHLGLCFFRAPKYYTGDKIGGYPKEAIWDVVLVYMLIIPLFLIASLWEFLSPWN